jgi:hypothetical protein
LEAKERCIYDAWMRNGGKKSVETYFAVSELDPYHHWIPIHKAIIS